MGFGGSSLSYYAAPYSAPFPTTATATANTTSSSSTLSPLAPPFTVDRAAPMPSLPYDPYVSPWPLRSQPSDEFLHLRPPSPSPPPGSPQRPAYEATTSADSLPYLGHGGPPSAPGLDRDPSGEASSWRNPNLSRAEPYYPHFSSAAATSVGDSPVFYGGRGEESLSASGYSGRHAALSDVPFGVGTQSEGVGRSSSWMERENTTVASGYGLSFHKDASTALGFVAYEDLLGGWHGKHTEPPSGKDNFKYDHFDWLDVGKNAGVPSDFSGTSALSPNASVGVCYPHSSDVRTFVEGSKTFDSNSSYDRFVCQANTDRTDPIAFYPATTNFPVRKTFASTSRKSASNDKHTLQNVNHVQDNNVYKTNMLQRGRVSIKPKEPTIDLDLERKGDYAERNGGENMIKADNANVSSSVVKITFPSRMESATEISQDYSLGKKSELRITNLKIPGSVECDREQSSFERLDENLAEDSPCWKGAPSSQRCVSSHFDTLVFNSALANQKFDNPHKRESDYSKVETNAVAVHSNGFIKDRDVLMLSKNHREKFDSNSDNVVQAVNEEKGCESATNVLFSEIANHCTEADPTQCNASSFCSVANDHSPVASKPVTDVSKKTVKPPVISDRSFANPTLGMDAQLLVKTIHNLSELLLSTRCFDENLLKEHDEELLCSAVNNIDICISRKAESTRPEPFFLSGNCSRKQLSALSEGSPKGRFQVAGSESIYGTMDHSNIRVCPGLRKVCNFAPTVVDGNHKKLSEMVMNESLYEHGEHSQAISCENLWFEVEDAVLLLKHKLQLLRSHIVMDNCKQQLAKDAEWGASNVLKLSSQSSKSGIVRESIPPWKSTDGLVKNPSPGKHENASNFQTPQQTISSSIESIDSKVDDIDASVMARFKVLKGRNDKLSCADVLEQHGLLNSLNVPSNSEIHVNICSPHPADSKLNSGMKFQTAHDAVAVGFGYQQLCHNGRAEGEVSDGHNAQHWDNAIYTEDLYLNSHFSEDNLAERFSATGTRGLANQSSVPDSRLGKHNVAGTRDSSSDWEHVLEEELTW